MPPVDPSDLPGRVCGQSIGDHTGWTLDAHGMPYCATCGERPVYRDDTRYVLRLLGIGTPAAVPENRKKRTRPPASSGGAPATCISGGNHVWQPFVGDLHNPRTAICTICHVITTKRDRVGVSASKAKATRRQERASALHDGVPPVDGTTVLRPAYVPSDQADAATRTISRADAQISVRSKAAKDAFVRGWIAEYGAACFYCERPLDDPDDYPQITPTQRDARIRSGSWPTVDHLIPHAAGGPSKVWNLVVACSPCNISKGDDVEHLVRLLRGLRDLVRTRDAQIRGAHTLIASLKLDLIALGSDREPHYDHGADGYFQGGADGAPRYCRRCGVEFLPGVPHTCIPRGYRDVADVYSTLGRRVVSALIAENHYAERRRFTTIRDRARGAQARAAARAVPPRVSTGL